LPLLFCGTSTSDIAAASPNHASLALGAHDDSRLTFPITTELEKDMDARTQRIRALNDQLRQNLATGVAVMTAGVAALGEEATARIIKTIAIFDDFCRANDPHEEHDFGSFEAEGHTIFFKIDYLDRSLSYHSPDPTDPAVTVRVITVMLADEY
jgi:Protein of unknown function (DUF3768)